jgi:hypothetical protein
VEPHSTYCSAHELSRTPSDPHPHRPPPRPPPHLDPNQLGVWGKWVSFLWVSVLLYHVAVGPPGAPTPAASAHAGAVRKVAAWLGCVWRPALRSSAQVSQLICVFLQVDWPSSSLACRRWRSEGRGPTTLKRGRPRPCCTMECQACSSSPAPSSGPQLAPDQQWPTSSHASGSESGCSFAGFNGAPAPVRRARS